MRRVSIKGVIIGGVVDVGGSMILGILVSIIVYYHIGLLHIPKDQVQSAIKAAFEGPVRMILMTLGIGGTVLGGFVAAMVAKHDEMLNGALSSLLSTAMGVYEMAAGKSSHSLRVQILMMIAAPLCAALGGYLSALQQRSLASRSAMVSD
jgi:hypothetical protein